MAGPHDGMEQMFNMWQEGQNAFFGAQKEMADTFAKTFSETFSPKPKDTAMQGYEAWQNFVKAWAPSWDPASAMRMTPNSYARNTDSMFSIFDPIADLEDVPFQPWARALYDARQVHELEPHARCKASGTARQFLTPYGVEFVEIPELQRLFIFDIGGPHTYHGIYGRTLTSNRSRAE